LPSSPPAGTAAGGAACGGGAGGRRRYRPRDAVARGRAASQTGHVGRHRHQCGDACASLDRRRRASASIGRLPARLPCSPAAARSSTQRNFGEVLNTASSRACCSWQLGWSRMFCPSHSISRVSVRMMAQGGAPLPPQRPYLRSQPVAASARARRCATTHRRSV
jgi:hypothetical protein